MSYVSEETDDRDVTYRAIVSCLVTGLVAGSIMYYGLSKNNMVEKGERSGLLKTISQEDVEPPNPSIMQ